MILRFFKSVNYKYAKKIKLDIEKNNITFWKKKNCLN